jgi:hypothetical protein
MLPSAGTTYIASISRRISEYWVLKDVEGSDPWPILGTIPTLAELVGYLTTLSLSKLYTIG